MATSDKRREVAERLRKAKAECDERGYPWMVEDLMQALGFERYEDGEDGIFDRLADLIDPICQEVPMESVGRWPFYTGIELHLEMVSYGCSVCGYPWGEIDKWATHGADWLHNSPKYCPNCGCRVVKGVMR